MIRLEPVFERIKYNALDYIDRYQAPVSSLSSILSSVVEQNGVEILFDTVRLEEAMRSNGAEEADIYRVCLMTQVTGLRELLKRDARTAQLDLDRYIQNAVEESCLNRDAILQIVSAISFAIGISMNVRENPSKDADHTTSKVAVLAYAVCRENLSKFKDAFEKAVFKKSTSVVLDFELIEPLVQYGIPKAKYYLGYCLLKGIQLEENETRGITLLHEAADAGDSTAAAALGDYYFEKGGSSNWTKAYEYYTGYGAIALNKNRKKAIVSILNHKLYNRKILGLCVILFFAFVATVIWAPATAVFAARPFWGWLAVAVQLTLLVLSILHYRSKPYDCVYTLPVAMSAIWFVYMAIRLLF